MFVYELHEKLQLQNQNHVAIAGLDQLSDLFILIRA